MNFPELSRHLPLSKGIRHSMVPLALLFVKYSDMVRRHGILSLEETHRNYRGTIVNKRVTDIFHRSLEWIIDGYEGEFVIGNFEAIIQSLKWSSKELLALKIIGEAVLLIQNGHNPYSVENRLFCWIGFDLFHEYEKLREKQRKLSRKAWEDQLDRFGTSFLETQNDRVTEPGYIDRILGALDGSSFRRLHKELESYQIGRALVSCRKETILWYFEQISTVCRYYALDYIQSGYDQLVKAMEQPQTDETAEAHQTIEKSRVEFEIVLEKTVRDLLTKGEIVLNRDNFSLDEIDLFLKREHND